MKPASAQSLTLLFTCVGRRVELVQSFRTAARRLGVTLRLIAADRSETAAAWACADERVLTPPIADAGYIPALLNTVKKHRVQALIPTIDTDLMVLSERRAEFESLGCLPLIAEPAVIRICWDKLETHRFLHGSGIDTPATYTPDGLRALSPRRFPYFIKPRHGSASAGAHKIEDAVDLDYYLARVPDAIVQEYVEGTEHTLDVYVGLTGEPRCVVPRARWHVRGGEVSKGVTVKDAQIMEAGRQVVEKLGGGLRGLVTLQCILTAERRIRFIEINPRFGGGAPLGIAAGADYPGWLIQELLGQTPQIPFDGFQHGLCMTRYDWSAFLPLTPDLGRLGGPPLRAYPEFE